MSNSIEHLEVIIDRTINLEPSENKINKIIELETPGDKENKIKK